MKVAIIDSSYASITRVTFDLIAETEDERRTLKRITGWHDPDETYQAAAAHEADADYEGTDLGAINITPPTDKAYANSNFVINIVPKWRRQ